jgi:hypothetical protein
MNREVHVRFWESAAVKSLCATQLSERLRERPGSGRESSGLFRVLQSRADSPIIGLSDAGSDLLSKKAPDSPGRKTGHGDDRVSLRSPIVGHYSATIFHENRVKRKIRGNQPIGSMEKPYGFSIDPIGSTMVFP